MALIGPWVAQSQLMDDFSDGNFSANPGWAGDASRFVVTNGELQLSDGMAAANNTSSLYVSAPTSLAASTVWQFYVRLNFSPSSSNLARVYLASSLPPGAASFTGYYLQIGGISGNADALELYRQDGINRSLLLSGDAGALGGATAIARVRVTRSTAGTWTLEADYTGATNWQVQGIATDNTYDLGQYMGVHCIYTATRADAFFFDDFLVDPLYTDQSAPNSITVEALNSLSLKLTANEPLEPGIASQPSRYFVDGGIGQVLTAQMDPQDPASVNLGLANPLTNLQTYQLTADGLADANGNAAATLQASFTYTEVGQIEPGDLIISEFMPDPSPPLGLPNAEYIELYNRSNKVLDVGGLGLSTGSTPQVLPSFLLLPNRYLIITNINSAADFAGQGQVLGLTSFPALTNTGDDIILLSAQGSTLFQLTYTDDWYADPDKAEGGFSLELIQLSGPYDCPGNWRASLSPTGGTPGKLNSVNGQATDQNSPTLINVFPLSAQELVLRFDDILDPTTAEDIALYTLSPSGNIIDAMLEADRYSVRLLLDAPLQTGQSYTLLIGAGLSDCLGNTTAPISRLVGLPQAPAPGDLVINEVLFNPFSGGVDFVELYNRSDKTIDLRGLRLANRSPDMPIDLEDIRVNYLVFPGDYIAITPFAPNIRQWYGLAKPEALIENDLPSLPDDRGNISLLGLDFIAIDSLDYDENWHSALLRDHNGISLERLQPNAPTQNAGNWHSAAGSVGYASPTGPNSQLREGNPPLETDKLFFLTEPTFSPDGDGFQDYLLLEYRQPEVGYLVDIQIFDAQGRETIRLGTRELLANEGAFLWDGSTRDAQKARVGIYVIVIEYYSPNGDTKRETHTCVLAGKLD